MSDKKVRTRVTVNPLPHVSNIEHPNPSVTLSVFRDVMMTTHQNSVMSAWIVPSEEEELGNDDGNDDIPDLYEREDDSTISNEENWAEKWSNVRNNKCALEEWADQYLNWYEEEKTPSTKRKECKHSRIKLNKMSLCIFPM